LKNGYEGIHLRKCDDFTVTNNKISGVAYYGIRVSGRKSSREQNFIAINNNVKSNNMNELKIKLPDSYSDNHVDGKMFSNLNGASSTAHIWLGAFSKDNKIAVQKDEKVIDEGENNSIKIM
jgi:hypothetical protein